MLLCLALCLAATLASGQEPIPKWRQIYSCGIEYYVPVNDYHASIKLWYDGVQNKSRVDNHLNTLQFYIEANETNLDYSPFIFIEPQTTEEHLNLRVCLLYHSRYKSNNILLPIAKDQYEYLGQERIHEKDTSHWQKVIRQDDIVQEVHVWVTHKDSVFAPVKYEYKLHDTEHGTLLDHFYADIFDFDVSPINPKVWDIGAGFDCKQIISPAKVHSADKALDIHKIVDSIQLQENVEKLDHVGKEFDQFKTRFSKVYESQDEHNKRFNIFKDNFKFINDHNVAGHRFKLKVNHLADRTEEEMALMRGSRPLTGPSKALPFPYSAEDIERLGQDLPEEFDWRPHGAVTPVKDQMTCGSCWAFSAVGAVEGALFLHQGRQQVVRLSEQVLVDCSWGFDNEGCLGGYPEKAFEWMKIHGLPTYDAYGGYIQHNGMCHIDNVTKTASVRAYYQIPEADERALQIALFKHGPIAVAIEAERFFFFYSHGVFYSPDCYSEKAALNHAVLVVGYGVLDGEKYWLVKNSWGTNWGTGGYILMSTKDNNCGVETDAYYVELE